MYSHHGRIYQTRHFRLDTRRVRKEQETGGFLNSVEVIVIDVVYVIYSNSISGLVAGGPVSTRLIY